MLDNLHLIPTLMIFMLLAFVYFGIPSAISFSFLGLLFGFLFLNLEFFFSIPSNLFNDLQQQQWLSIFLLFFINFFFKEYNEKFIQKKKINKFEFKRFLSIAACFYGSKHLINENFIGRKKEGNSNNNKYFLNYNLLTKITLPNIYILLLAVNMNLKVEDLLYYTIGPAILCCLILFPLNIYRFYKLTKQKTSSIKKQKVIFYNYSITIFYLFANILISFLIIFFTKHSALSLEHVLATSIILVSIFSFINVKHGDQLLNQSFRSTIKYGGFLLISLFSIKLFIIVFQALNGQNLLLGIFEVFPKEIEVKILIIISIIFLMQFIFSKVDLCVFFIPLLLQFLPIKSFYIYLILILTLFLFVNDDRTTIPQNKIKINQFFNKENKMNLAYYTTIYFLIISIIILFPEYVFLFEIFKL